jgi:Protein of unknown function (DUF3987)/RepB DNA-primase from phage plasmid
MSGATFTPGAEWQDVPEGATFTPGAEWQDVPEGAILSPGCQVEMDQTTGRRRARRLDPDLDEAARFLELLDPDAEFFVFQTFTDDPELKASYGQHDPFAKTFGGTLERCSETLTEWNREKSVGVFVTVNETRGHRRKAEFVTRVRAMCVDLDGAPLEPVLACPLEPHCIVESSPGKFHAYWLVDGLSLDQFEPVQRAGAARFGGDRKVCDLPRVMRLAGFWHHKGEPFRTRIYQDSARSPYSAEEILAEFPPVAGGRQGGKGRTLDFSRAGEEEGYVPDDKLIAGIITGEHFHDGLRNLACRYAKRRMRRDDVLKTVRGFMDASSNPRDARWQARYDAIERLVDSAVDWTAAFDAARREPPPEGWRQPAESERAPYPLEAFPIVLADAVREYQAHGKQPTDLIATSALVASAVAVQGLTDVRRDRLLLGTTSIYALVLADSGERKSSADEIFVAPIREAEHELLQEIGEQIKEAQHTHSVWMAKKEGLQARIKEKTKQGKSNDADQAERELKQLGDEPPIPPVPFILHEDATPEALARDLVRGWPSGALWSAEGGSILNSWAMADEKASVRLGAMLNKLWSREDYRSSRITREPIWLQGRRLSASIMVQPGVFARFLSANAGAARTTGLLARFLVCQPLSTMGTRLYQEPHDDGPAVARYGRTIKGLLHRPLPLDDEGRIDPPCLELSTGAKACWVDFFNAVEVELPGELEDVRDIASKIADQAVRLAAIFHVLEQGLEGPIEEDVMSRAVTVTSWYLVEMKRVLGLADVTVEEAHGRVLLSFLKKKGGPVWIKDITHEIGSRAIRSSAKVRDTAIEWLCDCGLARKFQMQGRTYVEANGE